MINIRICSLISSNFYIKNKPLHNFTQPAKANWPENRKFSFFVTINNASYSAAALAASAAQAGGNPAERRHCPIAACTAQFSQRQAPVLPL